MERIAALSTRLIAHSLPGLALVAVALASPGYADCKTDYDAALNLLKETLATLDTQNLPDREAFESQYSAAVQRMVTSRCEKELMELFQFAQDEKQRREQPTSPPQKP